jgi:hypothetical protein
MSYGGPVFSSSSAQTAPSKGREQDGRQTPRVALPPASVSIDPPLTKPEDREGRATI